MACRCQSGIWTSADISLIQNLGTNFSEILSQIYTFPFKKMHLKMSSTKCGWPFCLGLNVLIYCKSEVWYQFSSILLVYVFGTCCATVPLHRYPNIHISSHVSSLIKGNLNKDSGRSVLHLLWLSLIARFLGPTWGPSGAGRTQVGHMLASSTLLSVDMWGFKHIDVDIWIFYRLISFVGIWCIGMIKENLIKCGFLKKFFW